jgi:uncharacterized protein YcbX
MHLSALHIYPVKSCRGLSLSVAELDDYGLVGDRRFMVVNAADGMFLTQRSHPRMALIETTLSRDTLTLSSPNHDSVTIPTQTETGNLKSEMPVTVWKNTVIADDCGDKPAEWLSRFLGLPLRLVRMGEEYQRPVKPAKAQPGDEVSFADAFPFIVIGEASLTDLNSRLTDPLPMNRFRPSLVVAGSAPYDEDAWTRFKIGHITFRNAGPCARCVVTTTDQLTAERGKEPLRAFATFRRDPEDSTKVNFGSNLIHETKRGTLRVGDPVVLS